jgi:hypothetical protein
MPLLRRWSGKRSRVSAWLGFFFDLHPQAASRTTIYHAQRTQLLNLQIAASPCRMHAAQWWRLTQAQRGPRPVVAKP